MFDVTEARNTLSKEALKQLAPELRLNLINDQYDLKDRDFAVLIVLTGDDVPGVSEVVDRISEWMDARYIDTEVFLDPTEEERQRPEHWRYWRTLPARGRIGLHLGGWTRDVLSRRLLGGGSAAAFDEGVAHIRVLEQALADDGMLILKFWLHMPRTQLAKRLKRAKKHPDRASRVEPIDWEIFEHYDELIPLGERLVSATSADFAPWQVVDSTDPHYRDVTIARALHTAISDRLARPDDQKGHSRAVRTPAYAAGTGALSQVDLSVTLERQAYKERLDDLQGRLNGLSRQAQDKPLSSVVVFEGWDAAGKGGCIRRMTGAMAARDYTVVPIAAPSDEEKAHPYLWRFWRKLPRAGRMIIFDRSWYGRVLVERIEGFATEDEWRRAYAEINDFEAIIAEHGWPVFKFWLHLDPEEQLRRFQDREKTAYKKHKITDEDYRNRDKWGAYVEAANEMFARTSTSVASWTLVPANNKRYARIQCLETVCAGLERVLDT